MSKSTPSASPNSSDTKDRGKGVTITLKQHRYVLDWFEITDRQINLGDYAYFYLEHRCGDWYLCHYKHINNNQGRCNPCGNYWVHTCGDDFNVIDPVDAILKLGQKLKGYRSLHNNEHFPEVLCKLMESAAERKARAA